MNLHLIPKGTPVYVYWIDNIPIYSLKKNTGFESHISDQEAFIDLDDPDIIYHNPKNGAWYKFIVSNVEFGVDKKYLIKL